MGLAAKNGHKDTCRLLLNRRDTQMAQLREEGQSLNEEGAAKLLALEQLLEARDQLGLHPLHHAAYHGHSATCALLLLRGAEPNSKTNAGDTPHRLAEVAKELCVQERRTCFPRGEDYEKMVQRIAGYDTICELLPYVVGISSDEFLRAKFNEFLRADRAESVDRNSHGIKELLFEWNVEAKGKARKQIRERIREMSMLCRDIVQLLHAAVAGPDAFKLLKAQNAQVAVELKEAQVAAAAEAQTPETQPNTIWSQAVQAAQGVKVRVTGWLYTAGSIFSSNANARRLIESDLVSETQDDSGVSFITIA